MNFNSANRGENRWTTSYERIHTKYKEAGYEMPKLIFWNLAAGYGMYDSDSVTGGDDAAPKPVTAADEGTVVVGGYSQGQLKMFLENGQFTDEVEEETIEEKDEGDDAVLVERGVKKAKVDSLTTVIKAIGHDAYRMLKVVD